MKVSLVCDDTINITIDSVEKKNRFYIAVRLFRNRSQMTSKCAENKKVAHEAQLSVSLMKKQSKCENN